MQIYEEGPLLGEGTFGRVFKATNKEVGLNGTTASRFCVLGPLAMHL